MDTADCLREFQRKFLDTFFFFRKPSDTEETLVHCTGIEAVRDVDGNLKGGLLKVNSLDCGRLQFNIPSEQLFIFKPAPIGVYQYDKMAVCVLRNPARQWRRGICSENTYITPVLGGLGGRVVWSLELLSAIFQKKTYSIKEAATLLEKYGYISVAVGNGYALSLGSDTDTYTVMYHMLPCAVVKRDTMEIVSEFLPIHAQYFQDLLKGEVRNGNSR